MNDIITLMVQFAPAVAALLWIVYKQDQRLDKVTQRVIEMARECDCAEAEERERG